MAQYNAPPLLMPGRRPLRLIWLAILAFVLFLAVRWASEFAIEFSWWTELGQVDTWLQLFVWNYLPITVTTLFGFGVLWITHHRAMHFAGIAREEHRNYVRITSLILLGIAWVIAGASFDSWTVARFIGARGIGVAAGSFHDPVFQLPLRFYLFDLPFYASLRGYLLALAIFSAILFWVSARIWQLRYRFNEIREVREFDLSLLRLPGGLESLFFRGALGVVLIALAVRFFLGRYEMVWHEHGFMVGIDWLDEHVGIPMQWVLIGACVVAAIFAWLGRWRLVAATAILLPVSWLVPRLVSALYVKPNEISLETPYIDAHIHATRAAYGLEARVKEIEYRTDSRSTLDIVKHKSLLDNVRLWDWRAFHDTVTQSQALRPYYVFHDTDVDRYTIDGQYRQVLLTPRELDITQLKGASAGWINPRFIYTHGYGVALAEVSKLTPEGLPVFLIQNMPPQVSTPSLKVTRPEIYYGEVTQEPVFVHTAEQEFDYPSGPDNVRGRYQGKGGFPISSLPMRVAAAIQESDFNILLTSYLTPESRMMIHRRVRDRLHTLAAFIEWDTDPYLVITAQGRMVWMVDGYTTTDAHPYSRALEMPDGEPVNYIRNSVKATIDAYDGETHMYVFDEADPIIESYRVLFPQLFESVSKMPAELRAHARYPEFLFRAQAEIYRSYHMLNPQSFYNREDLWDLSRYSGGQDQAPDYVTPTYVVATLPGEDKPEFLLVTSFTPTSKENLIGVMLARCDGEHLGEMVVLLLSKQQLTLGPMQIGARINQDQNISKDLTLWNQQGSKVLRGQALVLPVEHTFLYVEPIYIQATEARMPQLRKVVLAMNNRLIYSDTYEQALAELNSPDSSTPATPAPANPGSPPVPAALPSNANPDPRVTRIRDHLRRYRELSAQGKWAEAGKELEAVESEVR